MTAQELLAKIVDLPIIEIGMENFVLGEQGCLINLRFVVAIEPREGQIVARYHPANHAARVGFLNLDPEPDAEHIAVMEADQNVPSQVMGEIAKEIASVIAVMEADQNVPSP